MSEALAAPTTLDPEVLRYLEHVRVEKRLAARGHGQAKVWYSALKSRPSFRAILADRMEGIRPPPDYDKLDF